MTSTVAPPARFLLVTAKRCSACQRTVFAVDPTGACPGCARRAPRPTVLEESHP